jgi:hypothetical protein
MYLLLFSGLWMFIHCCCYIVLLLTLYCYLHCIATYNVLLLTMYCYLHCIATYIVLLLTMYCYLHCIATYNVLLLTLYCYLQCIATYIVLLLTLYCYLHCIATYNKRLFLDLFVFVVCDKHCTLTVLFEIVTAIRREIVKLKGVSDVTHFVYSNHCSCRAWCFFNSD